MQLPINAAISWMCLFTHELYVAFYFHKTVEKKKKNKKHKESERKKKEAIL